MPFQYFCETCETTKSPEERLDEENCWICEKPLEPRYVCSCGEKFPYEKLLKNAVCPSCHKSIPSVKMAKNKLGGATMRNNELAISVENKTSINVIKNVNRVNLEVGGSPLAQVEDPSFAQFSSVTDYEKKEGSVSLNFETGTEEQVTQVRSLKKAKAGNLQLLKSLLDDGSEQQITEKTRERFREVISAISKDGSLRILNSARDKMKSKRKIWKKFDLSKKQYYSRLRKLRDLNIITKEGDGYILTDFGENILKSLSELGVAVADVEDVEVYEDKDDYAKSITSYDDFVDEIVELIRLAEEDIWFADLLADRRVLEKMLDLDDGVEFRALISEREMAELKQILKTFPKDEVDELRSLLNGSFRKCSDLPYSFVLKDENESLIEIKSFLHSKSFHQGFYSADEETFQSFQNLFNSMFNSRED